MSIVNDVIAITYMMQYRLYMEPFDCNHEAPMNPVLIRRCSICGEATSCALCRGFGTLPTSITVGTPGFGSFSLHHLEPCPACGSRGEDLHHPCLSAPYVPLVEFGGGS